MGHFEIYVAVEENDFDTNSAGTFSVEVDVETIGQLVLYVFHNTGAWLNYELEVWVAGKKEDETSSDYVLLPTSSISSTVDRITFDLDVYGFVKVKVKTAEGSPSTVNLLFNGLRF